MNLLLFIITIIISFIAVRIGAIVFELTGIEWSLAKFQALSCFGGTDFTTKEAELIVGTTKFNRRYPIQSGSCPHLKIESVPFSLKYEVY